VLSFRLQITRYLLHIDVIVGGPATPVDSQGPEQVLTDGVQVGNSVLHALSLLFVRIGDTFVYPKKDVSTVKTFRSRSPLSWLNMIALAVLTLYLLIEKVQSLNEKWGETCDMMLGNTRHATGSVSSRQPYKNVFILR
jgi:hypothetical protein